MAPFPLPPECFNIILTHIALNQDTATLATLLRVNKSVCQVTLPVLCSDPYHLKQYDLAIDPKATPVLTLLLLRQSPQDQLTALLKAAYFPRQASNVAKKKDTPVNQLINYRSYLTRLNFEPCTGPGANIFQNDMLKRNFTLANYRLQFVALDDYFEGTSPGRCASQRTCASSSFCLAKP
ncbi:hypothetical protein BGX29_000548 [Mortierella sp. GBA35]|nr:hypothetical protein BGX29_000548 [Mortierella sp. GBA35]